VPGDTEHLENLTHSQARSLKREMRKMKFERDAAVELLNEQLGGTMTGANQLVRDRAEQLEEQAERAAQGRSRKRRSNNAHRHTDPQN
jgi:hypothetical protein